jgi:hypothetical protein
MRNRRSSRLVPSFEPVEPRLAPTGGIPQGLFSAIQPGSPAQLSELIHLIQQQALAKRESALLQQQAVRDLQVAQLQTQAEKIRESANFALASGVVSGIGSIASGASYSGFASSVRTAHLLEQAASQHMSQAAKNAELAAAMRHQADELTKSMLDIIENMRSQRTQIINNIIGRV